MTSSFTKPDSPRQLVVFDLGAMLRYPIQVAIEPWHAERPFHWFSYSPDGCAIAEGQFLEAPGLPLFTLADEQGNRLSDAIPDDVFAVTRLMPAIDFELAQACATSEAARQLARDAPMLLILAVDHARRAPLSVQMFEQLLSLKRPAMLEAIGLPGSKSLSRLIRRIGLSPMQPWELEDVIKALTHPDFLALLRHHPDPHLNHLRFLLRLRSPLWPGVLGMVDKDTRALDITWLCRMIGDILNLAGRNTRLLSTTQSREELQVLHDRLVERFNRNRGQNSADRRQARAAELEQEHGAFPAPPVPPGEGMEPLASWLELLEEGASMHHCVGSYDIPVALGEVFIYRMMSPERLTISLDERNHRWVIGEVRGYCNASPSALAMDTVKRWVENQSKQGL